MRRIWGKLIGLIVLAPVVCAADNLPPATQPVKSEPAGPVDFGQQLEHLRAEGLLRPRMIDPRSLRGPTTVPSKIKTTVEDGPAKVPDNWTPFRINGYTYYIIPLGG